MSEKSGRRLTPGRNRGVQVVRVGQRKLFNAERKKLFLEWFAATSNVKLSAEKAGVAYQTVFKHRMKDSNFADAWDRALKQGFARLEAELLQRMLRARIEVDGDMEVPETEGFDPALAMQLLKEHRRSVDADAVRRLAQAGPAAGHEPRGGLRRAGEAAGGVREPDTRRQIDRQCRLIQDERGGSREDAKTRRWREFALRIAVAGSLSPAASEGHWSRTAVLRAFA